MSKTRLPLLRIIPFILSTFVAVLLVAPVMSSLGFSQVYAQSASLTLDSIGTSSTAGKSFTEWTYIGSNPILSGTAGADEAVTIKIDDVSHVVMADTSGNWTFTPTTLSAPGDYVINISTEDGGSYLFTLHLTDGTTTDSTSSADTDTKGGTTSGTVEMPETLPETGAFDSTIGLFVIGSIMIGIAMVTKAQFSEITEEE